MPELDANLDASRLAPAGQAEASSEEIAQSPRKSNLRVGEAVLKSRGMKQLGEDVVDHVIVEPVSWRSEGSLRGSEMGGAT